MARPPMPDLRNVPREQHQIAILSHRIECIESDLRELQQAVGNAPPKPAAPAAEPTRHPNPLID